MSRMEPAIDPVTFPATSSDWYWSSSPMVGDPRYAWVVGFDYGEAIGGKRTGRINRGGSLDHFVALRLLR
jgi:hypothetical protein